MTTNYDNQAVPIVNLPFYYINGFIASTDATSPQTVLDLSAGICRDSTNTYDMNLGNYNGQVNPSATANVSTSINCAVNGLNGLDTGSLGASKVYYVYVISDPVSGNPSGAMLSLAAPSVGPLMPFGYSAYRHVSFAVTDSSDHLLLGYWSGQNATRQFMYDAPISVGTTSSEASYTNINLIKFVPLINNIPVWLNYSASGTAGDTLSLQPGNATGDAVVIEMQVNSQAVKGQCMVLAQNVVISTVNSPVINYKNSGTDTIALTVGGFQFYI
jgi:hypothetical protein